MQNHIIASKIYLKTVNLDSTWDSLEKSVE